MSDTRSVSLLHLIWRIKVVIGDAFPSSEASAIICKNYSHPVSRSWPSLAVEIAVLANELSVKIESHSPGEGSAVPTRRRRHHRRRCCCRAAGFSPHPHFLFKPGNRFSPKKTFGNPCFFLPPLPRAQRMEQKHCLSLLVPASRSRPPLMIPFPGPDCPHQLFLLIQTEGKNNTW